MNFEDLSFSLFVFGVLALVVLVVDSFLSSKEERANRQFNATVGVLNYSIGIYVFGGITIYFFERLNVQYLWTIKWNSIELVCFVCFIVADLYFYLFHRFLHSNSFFYDIHALHHGPRSLNWTVSFRHSIVEAGLNFFGVLVVSYLLSVGMYFFGVFIGIISVYQLFLHQTSICFPRFLGHVLILPQDHWVHHESAGSLKNFGGMLSIWDRLFGSYLPSSTHTAYGEIDEMPTSLALQWLFPWIRKWHGSKSGEPQAPISSVDSCN